MSDKVLDSIVPVSKQGLSNRTVRVLGVRGYEEDGVAHLHIEDVSRGLGFERTQTKDGVEYTSIRWATVESYLAEFGFHQQVGENVNPHDYYIPENVFYRLCMKARNEVAEAFQAKVADEIIPSIRKTGGYSVAQTQPQPQPALPTTFLDALKALVKSEEEKLALQAERDEAVRTKAMIGSSREATAMNTASQKSKECKRLTIENEELKDAVGRGNNWRTVSMMKAEWKREFGHEPSWQKLMKFSADLPKDMQPIKDVDEKVVLHNGSEKVSKVYRYNIEAWDRYRQYEESIRVTDTENENT